jgi:hypothetical protein
MGRTQRQRGLRRDARPGGPHALHPGNPAVEGRDRATGHDSRGHHPPENAEPGLPDWLVQALVRVVGMPRTEVNKLSEPDAQRISRNGSQND